MAPRRLRPCPSCDRHVGATEEACPFCEATLEPCDQPPRLPKKRLGRGARFAFGAAAVATTLSLAACGDSDRRGGDAAARDAGPADAGIIATPYGAPPTDAIPQVV